MKTFLKQHFPKNKSRFMVYWKLFYPMLIGSTLYAFNGFVDNFMVGGIEQGGTALSAVNSWTNIMIGVFIGIASAGSVINAKYYFSHEYEKAQELMKFRINFAISISLVFAIISWVSPDTLIVVFLKKPSSIFSDLEAYQKALECSREYIKIISFSWILIAITSQVGNSLREIGHGKATMYWGYGTISINVCLNSILMFGLGFGVSGAAIASVAARLFALIFSFYWLISKKIKISFKVYSLLNIRWIIIKDFFSKWYLFLSLSFTIFFITLRNFFYDASYKAGEGHLGVGISAMSVLALTGAIMNIFTTTFAATGSMSAHIVGKELANGTEKRAFSYAKELKGFITFVSCVLALILLIVSFGIPYMNFLSEAQYNKAGVLTFDNSANLIQVRNSLLVVVVFYPIWIWFTTSYRAGCVGTKGFWFSFVDIVISGPVQMCWLALIAYGIVPSSSIIESNFALAYLLFFLSDLLKLLFQEILFYKYNWHSKISKMEYLQQKAEMDDEISGSQIDMQ